MKSSNEYSGDRPRYVPASTYRLQVHLRFPLGEAAAIVPYLARLGVAACYTSPYFTAAPGSTHGYDVADHNEINPEVGGAAAHAEFVRAIASHQMGHIVDFVPNHMGIGTGNNARWNDLLENGPSSPAAVFFDVDWSPVKAELRAKLLLPILGDQYGKVLERGELQLAFTDGSLVLRYFEQLLPVNPRQAPRVYRTAAEAVAAALGADSPPVHEFLSIIASLQNLPAYTESEPARIAERQREKEVARTRLARLSTEVADVRQAIEEAVRRFNGTPGQPGSFDELHELLEVQAYRLAYWRTASHEINYRRFFDINTLAGLRVEHPEVFAATHQLLAALIREGKVQGVRIDHPDGLFDPARYFLMLQRLAADAWAIPPDSGPDAARPYRPMYVVAEKILSAAEELPRRWAVHGTTGYNYLNELNGLFIDPAQARRARRVYSKLTGHEEPFEDVLYAAKRLIVSTAMSSELNVLANMLDRIGENNRRSRDFTLDALRDTITEVVACFPVYRTYVDEQGWVAEDRAIVARAIARARRRNPAMESSIFDFFREVVLPRDPNDESAPPPARERREGYPPADQREVRDRLLFAMKFQQYTGPVQAKGLEDTAFYRHNMLLSLSEVGGDPLRFGRAPEAFHDSNAARAADWPFEMLATATHDTKLGEDVRARINVISEMPDEWGHHVSRWMRMNRAHRTIVDGEPAPDRADEYRFYQALVGVWPPDLPEALAEAPGDLIDRLCEYMLKAVREAKVHTSWLTANQPYEEALVQFVRRSLAGQGGARFLGALLPFQARVGALGMINSLAQVALKLGSPGVPDVYQGTELWDLSLVDPDNRRPVDFDQRTRLLNEVDDLLARSPRDRAAMLSDWLREWQDGRIKLLVTAIGLRLRRELPHVFLGGGYLPLDTEVTVPGSAVAFARIAHRDAGPNDVAIFAAPRLCHALAGACPVPIGGECWKTSRVLLPPALAHRTFRHELTGAELRPTRSGDAAWIFLGEAFQTLPVAILRAVAASRG
ncbi:MAG: malto-oligosyltrehalose synthase [Acidobacteriota bacterium]|nr:malto-oligosyltrehalose synthase [Acidobacteriota bacterium]